MRARRLSLLILLALLPAVAATAQRRRATTPVAPRAESEYLRTARETSNWLASLERQYGDGVAWPVSIFRSTSYATGIDTGASGIGFFYLRAYEVTREPAYLDKAKRAANFVIARLGSGNILSYDWLNGAAGSGAFLLAVHQHTGDQRYLDGARTLGNWLVRTAVVDGDGVYWTAPGLVKTYTGLAHGAAGVSLFLLDLHVATHDDTYLTTAKRAYVWLKAYTLTAGPDGIIWKRLTSDSVDYSGWCGGTSGIMYFLHKLAAVSGDAEVMEMYVRTARGQVATAVPQRDGEAAWYQYGPGTSLGIIYCHGAASVAAAMMDAYEVTHDPRDLDAARQAANWISRIAVPEAAGYSWNHFHGSTLNKYTGLMTGTAGVGHVFLRLYRADPNPLYLERAKDAAAYLVAIAEHPNAGQSRWIDYTSREIAGDDPPTYATGWYSGAAGIGLFFLELDDTLRGRTPGDTEFFTGSNP